MIVNNREGWRGDRDETSGHKYGANSQIPDHVHLPTGHAY